MNLYDYLMRVTNIELFNVVSSYFRIFNPELDVIDPETFYNFIMCSRTDEVRVIITTLKKEKRKITFNFLKDGISISLSYFDALGTGTMCLDIDGFKFTAKDIPYLKFGPCSVQKTSFSFIYWSYHDIYQSICKCREILNIWTIGEDNQKFYNLIDHYRKSFDLDGTNFGDQDLIMYALFHYIHDYKDFVFETDYDPFEFIRYFILNHISNYRYIRCPKWEGLIKDENTIETRIKAAMEFKVGVLLLRDNIKDKYSLDENTMKSINFYGPGPLREDDMVIDTFKNIIYNYLKDSLLIYGQH